MLPHSLYYTLKPYLPWPMRMALRRVTARRKRAAYADVWPISQLAGHAPDGWPGWPNQKKFAFVITHDVEGKAGLAKVRQLAELEMEHGVRSTFNFIPEGEYTVPAELREWLVANGFEVGVHDLQHDGWLFRSRRGFARKAPRINHYVREWNASGFRSGFMLRNLDWLHALDTRYDSSTFDTDPFEPQSDGAGTIFPFWIPAPAGGNGSHDRRPGYVELPYTLPQDSTLFLVLAEKSPEIWLRKIDWIAERGGMALLNVHPDYIRFGDEPVSRRTYPVSHYITFLQHVKARHRDDYWHALPREVAAFVHALKHRPVARRPKRVGMITHSFYESDNRVVRYAEALAARGDQVDVFSLRRSDDTPRRETLNGVNVFRIQDRFGKTEKSILSYLWPALRFLLASSWHVGRRHARQRYDFLHVHNIPDFLVFAALYPKLSGAKVMLDIHDIVPEFFGSKFGSEKTAAVSMLKWVERRSARFAHHVIISNHLWLEKFAARTGTSNRCTVFINNVDSRVFRPVKRTRNDGKLIILFPGGLQWHQGLDIALRAFTRVSRELPNAEFHIYGDGNMKPALIQLTSELGLDDKVRFFDPVRITEVARIMANADLGVVPKRADSFGNEAYSTKIMEFMSLGVPVVVSKTKIDQFYFDDTTVRFFESGNHEALADAMLEVLKNAALRERLIANASDYSRRHSWTTRKSDYLALVDSLGDRRATQHAN